jgi:hypothetical protein
MENAISEILYRDIHQLDISRSLQNMFELNDIVRLQQLVDRPMEDWFAFIGFSQHLLNELINFLEGNRILSLIRN